MTEIKTKTILTIGNGIAAKCLHFELKNKENIKLINISANNFFSPCSHNSTAMNCLRGTSPNVSKLGDTIIESMEVFEEFYKKENPKGVELGFEYQILEESTIPKWERRYPEFFPISENSFLGNLIKDKSLYYKVPAYFLDFKKLTISMDKQINNITYIDSYVKGIIKENSYYRVLTLNGEYQADSVVLCTNFQTKNLATSIAEDFEYYINHSKSVVGNYLELSFASQYGLVFDECFNLSIEKFHFIYRKDEDLIQIGATHLNKESRELAQESDLLEIYNFVSNHLKFDIPAFENFEIKTGIRHKGFLRRPFWGKIDDHSLYSICGLYKNAFSFAFKAAKDLASQLD